MAKIPFGKNPSNPIIDWINKLKDYDYWRIFSRVAIGSIVFYILKVMKDVPNR